MIEIQEADWKTLREVRPIALDRFCQQILAEIVELAADQNQTNQQRYRAIYELIHRRDKELADAFDNPRRSTALLQLAHMRGLKLLTDEEMGRFSDITRDSLRILMGW